MSYSPRLSSHLLAVRLFKSAATIVKRKHPRSRTSGSKSRNSVSERIRSGVSLALIWALLLLPISPSMAKSSAENTKRAAGDLYARAEYEVEKTAEKATTKAKLPSWLRFGKKSNADASKSKLPQDPGMAARPAVPPITAPRRPQTEAELEARVARIEVTASSLSVEAGLPVTPVAIPYDAQGNIVHGVNLQWSSSDDSIISKSNRGHHFANKAGAAILTARVGAASATIPVTVLPSRGYFGGVKADTHSAPVHKAANDSVKDRKGTSTAKRDGNFGRRNDAKVRFIKSAFVRDEDGANFIARKSGKESDEESFKADANADTSVIGDGKDLKGKSANRIKANARAMNLSASMLQPENVDPLPDDQTNSLYAPSNSVGSPIGKKRRGAPIRAAADGGTEDPGSSNYTFSLPILNLPGRGMDVSLALTYNSRVWNKGYALGEYYMSYDVDNGWPSAGFKLGYGQLESQGSYGFTLTDPDGTRHQLTYTSANNYDSTDGAFIHFNGGQAGGKVTYANGSWAWFAAAGTNGFRSYPTQITDPNGNIIYIGYLNGVGPQIDTIADTMGRYVRFKYDSTTNDLVTVTAPGYAGGADRQVARFYYQDIALCSSGSFNSSVNPPAPSTAHVLRYVFYHDAELNSSNWMGYRFDYSEPYGVIHTTSNRRGIQISTTSDSSVGSVTNDGTEAASTYYEYPTTASGLTDAPAFTHRTDKWAGATNGWPVYTYANSSSPFADTTDGSNDQLDYSKVTAPNGTVTETDTYSAVGLWTDGLVKYVKVYNSSQTYSQTKMTWGLGANSANPRVTQIQVTNDVGQTKKTTFEGYDSHNNVGTVREYGYDNTEVRRTDYYYKGSPWTDNHILHLPESSFVTDSATNTVVTHSFFGYDEYSLTDRDANLVFHDSSYNVNYTTRGNLTHVTRYPDSSYSNGVTNATSYDIAGSPVSLQVSCCQQKSISYDSAYKYAYPTQVTSGSGPTLTTQATYDFDTGLARTSKDENNQQTSYDYYSDTLRLYQTTRPDGGTTQVFFRDDLINDPDSTHAHTQVNTVTTIDGTYSLSTYQFFDGRGMLTRDFGTNDNATGYVNTTDVEYDGMGRAFRRSNPYSAPSGGTTSINPTGLWTTSSFDALGRAYQTTLPDSTTVSTSFASATAGYAVTATDQAGKQRRQITDALGRLVRLDEPDSSGNLGGVNSPNQPTSYSYDILGDLTQVTQGSQTRTFKYDGLQRLIAQKLPEQQATLNDSGGSGSQWSSVFAYNDFGKLIDGYDARGVHTHISYDGLNRPSQVTYSDGTPTATYTYDEARTGYYNAGRLTTLSTAASGNAPATTQVYNYNQMGYVATSQQTVGSASYSFIYYYNLLGELTGETYPGGLGQNGRTINYAYQRVGYLNTIYDGSRTYDTIGIVDYDARGALKKETFGNGAVREIAYGNNRLQPTSVKLSIGGSEKQRFDYLYGQVDQSTGNVDSSKNNGQIGRIESYVNGTKLWQQRFSYDSLGRLGQASEYDGSNNQTYSVGYSFDRYGDRAVASGQTSAFSYVPVSSSDYDQSTNRFVSGTNVQYDNAGNVTSDAKFTNLQYVYDANSRQTSASTLSSSTVMTSIYDGAGQRVQSTSGGQTRTYVYDAFGNIAAEYVSGSLDREYVYRGSEPICIVEAGGSLKYMMTDLAGAPRVVTDGNAAIVSRHDYAPFGEEIGANVGGRTTAQGFSQTDNVRQGYAGMEKDSATNLSHTAWRKYDRASGRWHTPDPYSGSMSLADPQSHNRYSYVQNDPVNFIDPTGLCLFVQYGVETDNGNYTWWESYLCNDDGGMPMPEVSNPNVTGGGQDGKKETLRDCYRDKEKTRDEELAAELSSAKRNGVLFGGGGFLITGGTTAIFGGGWIGFLVAGAGGGLLGGGTVYYNYKDNVARIYRDFFRQLAQCDNDHPEEAEKSKEDARRETEKVINNFIQAGLIPVGSNLFRKINS